MLQSVLIVFFRTKWNKNSIHALIAAVDVHFPPPCEVEVVLASSWAELLSFIERGRGACRVVVGFSFTTLEWLLVESQVKTLRQRYSKEELFLMAGGSHATGSPEETLSIGFDLVVRGEGEETIGGVLHRLLANEEFSAVAGVSYTTDSGEIVHTPSAKSFVDLDKFPPFTLTRRQVGPVEITRGCPFACAFCQATHLVGARPRHRSVEVIVKLVEQMCASGTNDLRVITPNAFSYGSENGRDLDLERLGTFLREVRQVLGKDRSLYFGSFPSEVRPEHVNEETMGLLRKYTDNKDLIIGVQSGSDRMLKACHRGHGVREALEAVSLASKSGYQVSTDFIFGLPGETLEDLEATFELIAKLVEMGAKVHAHSFMPLAMTRFEHVPVEPLGEEVLARLGEYLHQGSIYGNWREQTKEMLRIFREKSRNKDLFLRGNANDFNGVEKN